MVMPWVVEPSDRQVAGPPESRRAYNTAAALISPLSAVYLPVRVMTSLSWIDRALLHAV